MFIGFNSVVVGTSVLGSSDIEVPATATHAELQADRASSATGVRYTMNGTDPTTTSGMCFLPAHEPKLFLIADLKRMRFVQDGTVSTRLNIHYIR